MIREFKCKVKGCPYKGDKLQMIYHEVLHREQDSKQNDRSVS